ncbi:MAG: flagellar protein FlgN [Pseudomonadota bacterium]
MTINTPHIVLGQLLETILELTEKLHVQLTREAVALGQRDSQAVATLSAEKQSLVGELGMLTLRLETWLRSMGYATGKDSMVDVLGKMKIEGQPASEMIARWARVCEISSQCKILNEANGARIELLNLHFRRAMQILSGQAHPTQTYGPDGSAKRDITNHSLVSV